MTKPDVRSIQRILALAVETLIRNGNAIEAEDAIRQGRKAADTLGPIGDRDVDPDDETIDREAAIRAEVLAAAGIVDAAPATKARH